MIINMVGGGGGAALNFKVVPGLTQPGKASENTIWVKTEQIGDWCFSATQPEGMQQWDVWFTVGTSSSVEFNALKKNGIQVYPLSVKQYVNGELVYRTAMIYQGGEWGSFLRPFLFKDGEVVNGNIVVKSGAILEIRNNNLYFYGASSHRAGFDFDLMSFANHNAVKFKIEGITNKVTFGFVTTVAELTGTDTFVAMQTITKTGWKTLDIPSGMSHAYLAIADAGQCDCTISEIEVI